MYEYLSDISAAQRTIWTLWCVWRCDSESARWTGLKKEEACKRREDSILFPCKKHIVYTHSESALNMMCVWWVEDTAVLVNTCSTTRTYIELWKHISLIKSGGAAGCREIGGRTPSPPAYEHGWCIPTAVDLVTMVEKLNRPHIFVWQHIQSFSFFGGSLLSPPHCSKKTPTYYTNS